MPDNIVQRPAIRTILTAAIVVTLTMILLRDRVVREMPDLEVYWRAGVRAAAAEPLYRVDDGHYQFKYLPAFAIVAVPLGLVTLQTAKPIWFGISVALLFALVGLSLRLPLERRKPGWLLIAATVVVLGKFYGHELILGQVNLLFGVAVAAALVALKQRRDIIAGALFAAAIVVKPYAVLFLPWLLALRRRRAAIGAVAGFAVAVLLPAIVYGVPGAVALHLAWWDTVSESTAPNLLNQDNVSLAAMFAKWLGRGPSATRLAAIGGAGLIAVAAFVFVRRGRLTFPEGLEGSLLLTMIPLLSPQGWDYVFLISTPGIVYLVNYEDRLPAALRTLTIVAMGTIGLSLYDVMGRSSYAAFMSLSIVSVCYLVLIAALATLRGRNIA